MSEFASQLSVAPVAIPMAAGTALVFLRDKPVVARAFALLANLAGLVAAWALVEQVRVGGVQTLAFGGWPAPFGIVFAVDMLGALMVLVTMVVSTATLAFACWSLDEERERMFFYALFQFLLMGVNGSFLTGDFFNLFVWFEVLLISSYGLMALGSEPYQLQETFKYLVINVVSSTLFLMGLGLLYALTGTLNMADASVKFAQVADPAVAGLLAVLFLVVFGLKGALFPMYMWLPRAYYAPPTVVSGLFGGLLTKVGVYALFRTTSLLFVDTVPFVLPLLVAISGATMLLGVLGALSQWDFKRILSYHIVSQIGYMIMGLGLFSRVALVGGIFYIVHHILVKTALFLIAGSVEKLRGTTHLNRLGGVIESAPLLTGLFFVAGLALAGAPPLSGFVAKFLLIRAGLESGAYVIVTVSIAVSFLTLFSMMKIFRYGFWREAVTGNIQAPGRIARICAVGVLVASGIALGLGAATALPYAEVAADQLLDTGPYIRAVLGDMS
jgi:multicomponent Na+:H+ antiporter subunit D